VFSAPKSLSLLALVGDDRRLITALEDSVRATLGWIEANLIEARKFDPASGAQVPVRTGHMVAATFTHDLSRNRDPQLHVHSVVANATLRPDGAWRALRNDPLTISKRRSRPCTMQICARGLRSWAIARGPLKSVAMASSRSRV
jgi:conjugative relaxase-like TrwC/TraI family protein